MTGVGQTTSGAGTNGFLFCDLRGYTAFVERHGDQAAADLLATYRTLVRAAIAAHAGAEIRTEGDSVYVVFPAASGAVEAGLAIVAAAAGQSTRERPVRVGVGIHAGETVATTEGLVGGAVNIAARVCAKAQAGEVLVTDTVRALTRTYLPYRYTGLGTQHLKGIGGGIPLYRVEAVPSSGRARLRRQLGARKGRVLAVAGLVVVLLGAGAGAYALNRPVDCLSLPASTKDVVARIDPKRNCVVATYPVGQRPGAIVVAASGVWVANVDGWTATRIDPATGIVVTTGTGGSPVSLAADPTGDLYVLLLDDRWIVNNYVSRYRLAELDGQSARIFEIRTLPAFAGGAQYDGGGAQYGGGYHSVAFARARAWVSNQTSGEVVRVKFGGADGGSVRIAVEQPGFVTAEPLPGEPTTVRGAGPGPIGAGAGAVWIASVNVGSVYRLDGSTGLPVRIGLDGDAGSIALAATDAAIWLGRTDGRLTRYDTVSGALVSVQVPGDLAALAVSPDSVWLADGQGRVLRRLDPASGRVLATIDVGGRPAGIAVAPDDSVYATISEH